MEPLFWDNRYAAAEGFVFGTAPNDFLAEMAVQIPSGPVLCIGEGEGRNAVHLATLGHDVTALDQSAVGLAKARQLAATRGVQIATQVADLETAVIEPGRWAGIVSIFVHLPVDLRRKVYAGVVRGLMPGGVFILEAYTPAQLAFGSGGPKDVALLMTLSALREELAGLDLLVAREIERAVIEGSGHTGRAAVVQVVARARGR
ncbi:MAG: class I SAM-dependent methyltransferase [Verrucomicrobia bacterium]|nr:class I SAM-dependent methyltransferase [Verrucomicrobiota bacterium]